MTTDIADEFRTRAHALVNKDLIWSGGAYRTGTGKEQAFVHPGDSTTFVTTPLASPADVATAVAEAKAAQPAWAATDPSTRREILLAVAATIREHTDELALLTTLEMGMPVRAAQAGVGLAADWFSYYAGMADKITGRVSRVGPAGSALNYADPSPYGVVGAIIPWNGPVIALALKAAPALAAGNAMVLKPSELAPFAALRIAELAHGAGLPAGVLNVVAAAADGGAALAENPDVDLLTFTGGNTAGSAVAAVAAARHIPAILELGGKSASIVFDDVDVRRVARISLAIGGVQNSGQGCFLPTRILVHEKIYDEFCEHLAEAARKVRLGDPFDPDTGMGPVVNGAAHRRINAVVETALNAGAGRLLVGGAQQPAEKGAFFEPTVFADADPASALCQEEIFGPVLAVTKFSTEAEAVEIANSTRYGLAGYVWTRDLTRAHQVAGQLTAGNVSVNGMSALPPNAGFGGWAASGIGTEGGEAGFYEFLRTKTIHVQL